ncbi:hypothetical protein CPB85DRAFT_351952 [Mucidula mucida]|nr:hypothetical protein CPB85DRAFT_351952 [Mucidula mucida]
MDDLEAPRSTGLDEIDAQIAQYESAVRVLKFQRNMLAPISRLPVEVLCQIFILTTYTTCPPLWMAVTHVCSQWRAAALKCPAMWSYITFERPSRWTNEMLQRSMEAPLTLHVLDHWRLNRMLKTVSTALEHIGRTVELRLRGDFSTLTKSLNQPAPNLHTLTLEYNNSASYSGIPGQSVSLPDDFLGGDTPRLRHLELKQCHLTWNSGILKGLTHLELKGPTSHPANIAEVTTALSNTPMLEVLHLHGILESMDAATYTTLSRSQHLITLAHLSRLHLHSGVVPATKLLLHLSFPSDVVIDMSVYATTSSCTPHDFGPFLSALNECGVDSTRVLDRSMNMFSLDSVSFSNSLRVRFWPNQGPYVDSPFQLVMTWDRGLASYKSVLQTIGDAFPLSRIRNLRIHLDAVVVGWRPLVSSKHVNS